MRAPELCVVMPVHNEQNAIRAVVTEWTAELDRIGLDYELSVYDDGSTDGTVAILEALRLSVPRLTLRSHGNRGHGATVLRGYRDARAEWIFQTDSDGEMAAAAFRSLWEQRPAADLLLGYRAGRQAPLTRRFVSHATRLLVWSLFGRRFQDVNTPFRLMRRSAFERLLPIVSDDCFAPNVALAGLAAVAGLRVCEIPVPHLGRRTGRTSLQGAKLWRASARSFWQTLGLALRARRQSSS